jgi:hypothetical protein
MNRTKLLKKWNILQLKIIGGHLIWGEKEDQLQKFLTNK